MPGAQFVCPKTAPVRRQRWEATFRSMTENPSKTQPKTTPQVQTAPETVKDGLRGSKFLPKKLFFVEVCPSTLPAKSPEPPKIRSISMLMMPKQTAGLNKDPQKDCPRHPTQNNPLCDGFRGAHAQNANRNPNQVPFRPEVCTRWRRSCSSDGEKTPLPHRRAPKTGMQRHESQSQIPRLPLHVVALPYWPGAASFLQRVGSGRRKIRRSGSLICSGNQKTPAPERIDPRNESKDCEPIPASGVLLDSPVANPPNLWNLGGWAWKTSACFCNLLGRSLTR